MPIEALYRLVWISMRMEGFEQFPHRSFLSEIIFTRCWPNAKTEPLLARSFVKVRFRLTRLHSSSERSGIKRRNGQNRDMQKGSPRNEWSLFAKIPRGGGLLNLREHLMHELRDVEARYAYADSVTNALISSQIKALQEERELTQEELARLLGTKQSGVSRWLKSDYSGWKVDTLRKFARAFGVRLCVSFEEFGTLLADIRGFNSKRLSPRNFENDPTLSRAPMHRSSKVRSRVPQSRRPGQTRLARGASKKPPASARSGDTSAGEAIAGRIQPVGLLIDRSDIGSSNNASTPTTSLPITGNESTGLPWRE